MAAAIVSYDIGHRAPWDWRVSLYTWTKGIAAGAYLAPLVLALAGRLDWTSSLWRWAAPALALGFLAATGAILIADLEHPRRFPLIFLRPQWKSWLVRGAALITAYAAVLVLHLAFSLAGWTQPQEWLAIAGLPLAAMAAVYTGYLFAQAKGRDLWQSPLLPPHLLVQAVLLGAAITLPFARWLAEGAAGPLEWLLGGAALVHLVMVAGEITLTHPTAHARRAAHTMVLGRYAAYFWVGAALVAVAVFAPAIGIAAAPFALAGLLAHEHAYVQAGQSVPLA
jgi:formate-dependent nitrite reductase membrane component NrfD